MHTTTDRLLSILYPRRCPGCDRVIERRALICGECAQKLHIISRDTCMKCGKPMKDSARKYCRDCSGRLHVYDRGFAVFEYEDIKQSLYRFKYSQRPEYARFYAAATAQKLGGILKKLGIEALVPVPIHKSRYIKRGYNQAYVYARELSDLTGIPVNNSLIMRSVKTTPLKELDPQGRQKNLKGAFKPIKNDVKLSKVCVIDDIYTTGATIDTIAQVLKSGGISEVYFVTIAIGNGL